MATKKKLEAVKDGQVEAANELVQDAIEGGAAPAVGQAAGVMGEQAPNTHALVALGSVERIVIFLHGVGSDMAKGFAAELSQSRGVRVERK